MSETVRRSSRTSGETTPLQVTLPPVVLDTNIFVGGGFNPGSASARLIEAVRSGQLRMVWSEETRAETRRILEKIPPLDWDAVAELFDEAGRVEISVDLTDPRWSGIPDEEDRKFAALAVEGDAILITSDAHLLEADGDGLPRRATPGQAAGELGLK